MSIWEIQQIPKPPLIATQERGAAVRWRIVEPHQRNAALGTALWIFLIAVFVAFDAVPAAAGFIPPDAATSADELKIPTESLIGSILSQWNSEDASFENSSGENSGGAGMDSEPKDPSPALPAGPSDKLPIDIAFDSGLASSAAGRSFGSSASSGAGGSSAAAGMTAASWKLSIPVLWSWLRIRECLIVPSAPPNELFRPPPVDTIHS